MSINIINRALIKLGQPIISSTNQELNGKIFGLVYQDIKDLLLSSHTWRFALKTVILARDAETPVSSFAYAYTLPSDFLSLYRFGQYFKQPNYSDNIQSSDERYSIEGDKILCDQKDQLYISYIARISDTSKFTPWFKEALAAKLAAEFSGRVKQSTSLAKLFNEEFAQCLVQAELNNELMTDSQTVPDGSWVGAREGWSNEY